MTMNFRAPFVGGLNFYNPTLIVGDNATPDQFTLGAEIQANAPSAQFNRQVTLQGMDAGTTAPVQIENATYSINGSTPASNDGIAPAGATISVFITAPAYSASFTVRLTVGGVTATLLVSTIAQPNIAPTVQLTAPVAGAEFVFGQAIQLSATASDSDGSVTRVEFYSGTEFVGVSTALPHELSWVDAPAGTHSITARSFDDDGAQTSSTSVAISVIDSAANDSVDITGLSESEFAKSKDYGQHLVLRGDDFAFLFRPPFETDGWKFTVTLRKEEVGAPTLIARTATGSDIRGVISATELNDLEAGDYLLVARMNKGGYDDTDIIRFHLGEIG